MDKPTTNSKSQLWAALERLMLVRYGKVNILRLSKESDVGLGTVARLKDPDTTIGLDKADLMARALDVPLWQLLNPAYDPAKPELQLSPMARDLACALDQIPDEATRMQRYALALQIVQLPSAPAPGTPAP